MGPLGPLRVGAKPPSPSTPLIYQQNAVNTGVKYYAFNVMVERWKYPVWKNTHPDHNQTSECGTW